MTGRTWLARTLTVATVAAGSLALPAATQAAGAAPIPLVVSQAVGFKVLGYSCGGVKQSDYATGFDATTGYPDGAVFLWTTCSAGGRGGRTFTVKKWISTQWDLTGALVTYTVLAAPPPLDPVLSIFDTSVNHLYNQSNLAYLDLAPGFVPAPRLAGVSPAAAPQGTTVAISGTGFTAATAVTFGTLAATFTVVSDTTISAVVPAAKKGTVNVTVSGPGGTSAVTTSDTFKFLGIPGVGGLAPTSGSVDGGTVVTITGSNFTGTTAVWFGGVAAASFKVVNATTITATTPEYLDPATVDVVVANRKGSSVTSPADRFTFV